MNPDDGKHCPACGAENYARQTTDDEELVHDVSVQVALSTSPRELCDRHKDLRDREKTT